MRNTMEQEKIKSMLPPPIFKQIKTKLPSPHFASPTGMLLPKEDQPPPMFGPQGATIPAKYLQKYKFHIEKYNQKFKENCNNKNNNFQQKLWCENCDLSFKNQFQLNKHTSEYRKCIIEDCSFQGCSKSMTNHVEELHTTGLYEKIKNLNTPEELAKWRDERRRRYPTIANVELRQKAQEERKKRGECIESNKGRFGPKTDRRKINSGVNNELKRKQQGGFDQSRNGRKQFKKQIEPRNIQNSNKHDGNMKPKIPNKSKSKDKLIEEDEDDDFNGSVPKFKGTSSIPDYRKIKINKKDTENVLAGLLGMYGESSDSDQNISDSENKSNDKEYSESRNCTNINIKCSSSTLECSEDIKSEMDKENTQDSQNVSIEDSTVETNKINHTNPSFDIEIENETPDSSVLEENNEDMPEEQPILRTALDNSLDTTKPLPRDSREIEKSFNNQNNVNKIDGTRKQTRFRSKVRQKGFLLDYSKLRKTPQNTLLEKLLEPQIVHERNVLLQCVRYVVTNKFFGIGQTTENAVVDNKNKLAINENDS